MEPRKVKTAADAKALVAERELTHVKVGAFDIDGILRGKYLSRSKSRIRPRGRIRLLRCRNT